MKRDGAGLVPRPSKGGHGAKGRSAKEAPPVRRAARREWKEWNERGVRVECPVWMKLTDKVV